MARSRWAWVAVVTVGAILLVLAWRVQILESMRPKPHSVSAHAAVSEARGARYFVLTAYPVEP